MFIIIVSGESEGEQVHTLLAQCTVFALCVVCVKSPLGAQRDHVAFENKGYGHGSLVYMRNENKQHLGLV